MRLSVLLGAIFDIQRFRAVQFYVTAIFYAAHFYDAAILWVLATNVGIMSALRYFQSATIIA
jgi:hypothetical protein